MDHTIGRQGLGDDDVGLPGGMGEVALGGFSPGHSGDCETLVARLACPMLNGPQPRKSSADHLSGKAQFGNF